MPVRILKRAWEYIRTTAEVFSFWFLLRTFFKPWKSIKDKYPKKGFNLTLFAEAFTLNCTSRVIGMIFRTVALVIGILMELIVIAVCIAVFLVWVLFPLLFILDLLYLIGGIS